MNLGYILILYCLVSLVGCIELKRKSPVQNPQNFKTNELKVVRPNPVNDCTQSLINKARCNLIGCSIVYGSNYVVSKSLLRTIPPDLLNVFRFFLAFTYFLPTVISLKNKRRPTLVGMELGLFCAIGFIAQSIALQRSSSNKVAFFISLGVLMPPLFDVIGNFVAKLSKKSVASVASSDNKSMTSALFHRVLQSPFIAPFMAIIGASILEFTNGMDPAKIGDILLLISPITFSLCFYRSAIHAVDTAKLSVSDEEKFENTKYITAIMMLTTSVLSAMYAYSYNQLPLTLISWNLLLSKIMSKWQTVSLLLYTSLVCTGWTAISEQKALRILSAGDINMIYTLEPLFATLFGVIFLSEVITRNICIGAVFILAACLYPTLVSNFVLVVK